jgi:hypothetical protein
MRSETANVTEAEERYALHNFVVGEKGIAAAK